MINNTCLNPTGKGRTKMETIQTGEKGGKCNQRDCFRKATEGMKVGYNGDEVWFCNKHISEAMEDWAKSPMED